MKKGNFQVTITILFLMVAIGLIAFGYCWFMSMSEPVENEYKISKCLEGEGIAFNNQVFICIEGEYKRIGCFGDWHCENEFSECINNFCVNFEPICEEIAKIDYNLVNPSCSFNSYKNYCYCSDYIIDSPEKIIKKNNSFQVIEKKWHYENSVGFYIVPEEVIK